MLWSGCFTFVRTFQTCQACTPAEPPPPPPPPPGGPACPQSACSPVASTMSAPRSPLSLWPACLSASGDPRQVQAAHESTALQPAVHSFSSASPEAGPLPAGGHAAPTGPAPALPGRQCPLLQPASVPTVRWPGLQGSNALSCKRPHVSCSNACAQLEHTNEHSRTCCSL